VKLTQHFADPFPNFYRDQKVRNIASIFDRSRFCRFLDKRGEHRRLPRWKLWEG